MPPRFVRFSTFDATRVDIRNAAHELRSEPPKFLIILDALARDASSQRLPGWSERVHSYAHRTTFADLRVRTCMWAATCRMRPRELFKCSQLATQPAKALASADAAHGIVTAEMTVQ